ANPDFTLSTTTTANDTLTINTAAGHAPAASFNISLGDQDDTLAFGLSVTPNGVTDVAIDGGTGADTVTLNATSITGSLTASAETLSVDGAVSSTAGNDITLTAGAPDSSVTDILTINADVTASGGNGSI